MIADLNLHGLSTPKRLSAGGFDDRGRLRTKKVDSMKIRSAIENLHVLCEYETAEVRDDPTDVGPVQFNQHAIIKPDQHQIRKHPTSSLQEEGSNHTGGLTGERIRHQSLEEILGIRTDQFDHRTVHAIEDSRRSSNRRVFGFQFPKVEDDFTSRFTAFFDHAPRDRLQLHARRDLSINLIPSNLGGRCGHLAAMLEEAIQDEEMSGGQRRLIHARSREEWTETRRIIVPAPLVTEPDGETRPHRRPIIKGFGSKLPYRLVSTRTPSKHAWRVLTMNIDLLKRLCEIPGIPGREERVRAVIEQEVDGLFDEMEVDPLGSLICRRNATRKTRGRKSAGTVLIAAHMDEIGFYVRHVDEHGFLWVNAAGGFDPRNLFSRRVMVCTDSGDHLGVMNPGGKPIHISSPADRSKVPGVEEFFIDLGMPAAKVQKLVKIGDYVVMHEPFLDQPESVVSKALDNRFACWTAIEAVRKLDKAKGAAGNHALDIVVGFTVQEEVGLRGAGIAANRVGADYGIGLDVTLSCDTPGVPTTERVTKQGDGAAVMIQDSSMIADYRLVDEFCAVARKHRIPHQRCILGRGGQDGAAIQRSGDGARCIAITAGTRYIHTVTESMRKSDAQAAVDLLAAWLHQAK